MGRVSKETETRVLAQGMGTLEKRGNPTSLHSLPSLPLLPELLGTEQNVFFCRSGIAVTSGQRHTCSYGHSGHFSLTPEPELVHGCWWESRGPSRYRGRPALMLVETLIFTFFKLSTSIHV
jgi:hypothetical protein